MKSKILDNIKSWIFNWIWFIWIITIGWIVYATVYNWSTLPATSWEILSKAKWDKLVEYSVPPGAVIAFNWDNCPNWWALADGSWDETKTDWTNSTLDLRWEFIRWLDKWRWVDGSRVLWSSQLSTAFFPEIWWDTTNSKAAYLWILNTDWSFTWTFNNLTWPWLSHWFVSSTLPAPDNNIRTIYKIRPRNIALLYCVKTNQ